jgi:hypothetical protein
MKFLRLLVVVVLFVVAFLIVDHNFGSYATRYECYGTLLKKSGPQNPLTLFIQITHYRWWRVTVSLAGALRSEIPVGATVRPRTDLFAMTRNGSYLILYPWPKDGETVETASQRGQFSTISNSLVLNISDDEQFQGSCEPKNN